MAKWSIIHRALNRWRYPKPVQETYRVVFGSQDGVLVLEDMAKAHKLYESTISLDSTGKVDPIATALREGERNVILRILTIINSEG